MLTQHSIIGVRHLRLLSSSQLHSWLPIVSRPQCVISSSQMPATSLGCFVFARRRMKRCAQPKWQNRQNIKTLLLLCQVRPGRKQRKHFYTSCLRSERKIKYRCAQQVSARPHENKQKDTPQLKVIERMKHKTRTRWKLIS